MNHHYHLILLLVLTVVDAQTCAIGSVSWYLSYYNTMGNLGGVYTGTSYYIGSVPYCNVDYALNSCANGICGLTPTTRIPIPYRANYSVITCYADLLAMMPYTGITNSTFFGPVPVFVMGDSSGSSFGATPGAYTNAIQIISGALTDPDPDIHYTAIPNIIASTGPTYFSIDANFFFVTRMNYPSAAQVRTAGGSLTYNIQLVSGCTGGFTVTYQNCLVPGTSCYTQFMGAQPTIAPTGAPTTAPSSSSFWNLGSELGVGIGGSVMLVIIGIWSCYKCNSDPLAQVKQPNDPDDAFVKSGDSVDDVDSKSELPDVPDQQDANAEDGKPSSSGSWFFGSHE